MNRITTIIIAVFLITSIAIVGTAAGEDGEKVDEFIVEGEENIRDEYNVLDSLEIGNKTYYVFKIDDSVDYEKVKNRPNVDPNYKVSVMEPVEQEEVDSADISTSNHQDSRWNMRNINADHLPVDKESLENIDVSVMDNGIDENHPYLNSEAWELPENSSTNNNHGTHVTGIISGEYNPSNGVKGVAPGVDTYDIKIIGEPRLYDLAWAIRDAAEGPDLVPGSEDDAEVISMSVSTEETDMIRQTISNYHPDTTFVAAAGNNQLGSVTFPANHPDVIAVSATGRNNNFKSFSSVGPEIDIAAPGDSVLSLANGGGYTQLSGTSMSAPHVSGAVAALIASDSWSPNANVIEKKLKMSATDIGSRERHVGAGQLNVERLLNVEIKPEIKNIQPDTEHLTNSRNKITFDVDTFRDAPVEYYYDITAVGAEPVGYKSINKQEFTVDVPNYEDDSSIEVHVKAVNQRGKESIVSKQYQISKTPESKINVKSINIPKTLQSGQTKNVEISLENKGAASGTFTGELNISGNIRQIQENIRYESEKTVEIPLSFEEPGVKQIRLTSDNPNVDKSKELVVINSNFEISTFRLSSQELEKPGTVETTIVLSNAKSKPIDVVGYVLGEDISTKYITGSIEANNEKRIIKNLNIRESTQIRVKITEPSGVKDKTKYVNVKSSEEEPPEPPEPPERPDVDSDIKIKDFFVDDVFVRVGEETNLTTVLQNDGGRIGIFNGYYHFKNKKVMESITVGSEDENTIKIPISFNETGEKEVTLEPTARELENKTISINVEDENLRIEKFEVGEDAVEQGEEFNVSLVMSNEGENDEEFVGEIRIVETNKSVGVRESISPGETEIVKQLSIDEVGSKTLTIVPTEHPTIDSRRDSVEVEKKEDVEEPPESESHLEISKFNISKNDITVGEKAEITVGFRNNRDVDSSGLVRLNATGKGTFKTIMVNVEPNSTVEKSVDVLFAERGEKRIGVNPVSPENMTGRTTTINVSENKDLFEFPLLPEFDSPPKNTGVIDDRLYEDLDGDGNTTDVRPTVEVYVEVVTDKDNFTDNLTKQELRLLDWNQDGSFDEEDIVILFKKQSRLSENMTTTSIESFREK